MKLKIYLLILLFFAAILSIYIYSFVYANKPNSESLSPNCYRFKSFVLIKKPYSMQRRLLPAPIPCEIYNPNTIFIDNFDNDTLNESFWNKVNRTEKYNDELQEYNEENVCIEQSCLVLTAKEHNGCYTSGMVSTQSKLEFLYGTVEVRMKYPSGRSFFPAIWMLPANYERYPEVDILEVVGDRPNKLYFVHHYYDHRKRTSYAAYFLDDYDAFHTYSLKWTPENMVWYVDNHEVHRTEKNIPHEKMYLIVNFAVGGEWPGNPDKNTIFPSKVLVDYVKIIPYRPLNKELLNDID